MFDKRQIIKRKINQLYIAKQFSLLIMVIFLIGCEPTPSINRVFTFEGALSEDCLMRSASSIGATFTERSDDLETSPFPFEFLIRTDSDSNSRAAGIIWERGEIQLLRASIFSVGSIPQERLTGFCTIASEFFTAVETECMIQPGTSDLTDTFSNARC